ncbi:uncharacterized protein [Physcomitrium patens]|uniref:uncharacterized protein n=1 Tax=Physcomitrium patens TaxID=3218 RepID=UPI003CCDFC08
MLVADYTARFVEYQTMLLPANIFVNSDPNSFCGHAFVNDNSFRLGFFLSMLSRMESRMTPAKHAFFHLL